jgi:hypothetical protein
MSAEIAVACEHFVHKWRQREPEMRLAEVFCARADAVSGSANGATAALRFTAWGALLHELREAVFEIAEPAVAGAKRGWWAEELQLIAGGAPRHPLAKALASYPEARSAPWSQLARSLLNGGGEPRAGDGAKAIAALLPLAESTLAVENAVFQARGNSEAARTLAVHWLLHRLPAGLGEDDGARIPMHLLARHGLTAAQLPAALGPPAPRGTRASRPSQAPSPLLQDWAAELALALPPRLEGAAFLRRARARFDAARLQNLARRGGAGGFDEAAAAGTLWRAWRAAVAG